MSDRPFKRPDVRALSFDDFPSWLPLWIENNQGQNDEAVTSQTWQRLCDPASMVHGLGAFDEDGTLLGILHYILHPTTGSLHPACYMQDLFVTPAQRGKGVAKVLLAELERTHRREKWARIYWLAERYNPEAQALYKKFGVEIPFSVHVLI